ncbi:TPA: hypothetical protein I7280_27745 [Vibrio parahaemolyticus]|nr:hypothetical protein [Vibrio parahaemolyticus]HAS6998620.1 hypothetical protein [Vibrio parahaemolyticus]
MERVFVFVIHSLIMVKNIHEDTDYSQHFFSYALLIFAKRVFTLNCLEFLKNIILVNANRLAIFK